MKTNLNDYFKFSKTVTLEFNPNGIQPTLLNQLFLSALACGALAYSTLACGALSAALGPLACFTYPNLI